MLGDIDTSLSINYPDLFICKTNGKTIGKMPEALNVIYKAKLGNLGELDLDVPYEIIRNGEIITNRNIGKLRDRYLIRYENGNIREWFMIVEPTIAIDDDKNYKTIKCYSLGYELKGQTIVSYQTYTLAEDGSMIDTPYNATKLFTDALNGTLWNIGYIDPYFDTMYRSFNETNTNALDFLLKVADTFQGVLTFDTDKREVSMLQLKNVGSNKGLRFSYGSLAKTVKKDHIQDSLCTVLKVIGKDGVTIDSVNPTGSDTLEDFSFFLYPYQEDENGNMLQRSYYMSPDLCHAILAYNKKVQANQGVYTNYLNELASYRNTLTQQQNDMDTLQEQYTSLTNQINVNQSTNVDASSLISQRNTIQTQINSKQTDMNNTNAQISSVQTQISSLQQSLSLENNFTPKQILERKLYEIQLPYTETRATTPQDLYDAAVSAFQTLKMPQTVITIDIVDFLEILEEQHKFKKLNLGDTVRIYYPQYDTDVLAQIVEIDFNFEESQVNVIISNTYDLVNDKQKFFDMLTQAIGTSNTLDMSKFKWDGIESTSTQVQQILNNKWDATKRAIVAGTNESVTIDGSGITITNSSDPNKLVRINHGAIGFSDDGANTFELALDSTGIYAKNLVGQVILGENLSIQSNDGVLQFIGNRGIIADNTGKQVMSMGLYDSTNGVNSYGIELFGTNNRVYLDSNFGLKITDSTGQTNLLWTDTNGNINAQNASITGNISCTTLSIAGKNALTSDNSFIDGSILKNIHADTITTGKLTVGTGGISMVGNITWDTSGSSGITPPSASQIGAVANNQTAVFNTLTNNGASQGLFMSNGQLYVNASYINGGTINGITIIGSTVKTAASGTRVELTSGYADINMYNGNTNFFRLQNNADNTATIMNPLGGGAFYVGAYNNTVYPNGTWNFSNASISNLSTTSVGDHNHGIPAGTQLLYGTYNNTTGTWQITGGVGFSASGGHSHSVT